MALSVIFWALSVEKRVSNNEINISILKSSFSESLDTMETRLDRIENKLDRVIERSLTK